MTDLTYCYLHMTDAEIDSLDQLDDPDYWDYAISDEELQIPSYMVPPDPDDTECLPSNIHVSYPYGDPTRLSHPATQANRHIDPNSRAIYDDTGGNGNTNVAMVWKDLALDILLPVDPVKEEAARAAKARRLANGAQQGDGDDTQEFNHDLDEDEHSSTPEEEEFEGDPEEDPDEDNFDEDEEEPDD